MPVNRGIQVDEDGIDGSFCSVQSHQRRRIPASQNGEGNEAELYRSLHSWQLPSRSKWIQKHFAIIKAIWSTQLGRERGAEGQSQLDSLRAQKRTMQEFCFICVKKWRCLSWPSSSSIKLLPSKAHGKRGEIPHFALLAWNDVSVSNVLIGCVPSIDFNSRIGQIELMSVFVMINRCT